MSWLRAALIILICSFCTSNVIQIPRHESIAGEDLNLTCSHASLSSEYVLWYRMIPGQGPVFLIRALKDTDLQENRYKIMFGKDKESSVLYIRDVKPEDSAVYLCGRSDDARKVIFGQGTNLKVSPKTEREIPSVYKLQADKADGLPSTVCLVTDFPTPNTTLTVDGQEIKLGDKSALDKSNSDVWRYGAVVWDNDNPSKDLPCKVTYDGKDVPQEKIIDETATTCSSLTINERFRTNPGMNTLSLSVLGLRMLTAKAVIFQLLLTLRLLPS